MLSDSVGVKIENLITVYKMENYLGSAVHDNVFGYACPPGCQDASAPICANFLIRNFRIRSFPGD